MSTTPMRSSSTCAGRWTGFRRCRWTASPSGRHRAPRARTMRPRLPVLGECPPALFPDSCSANQRDSTLKRSAKRARRWRCAARVTHCQCRNKATRSNAAREGEEKRAMGFEPTTSSLGSWHSTTELRPQPYFLQLSRVTLRRQVLLDPVEYAFNPFGCSYLPANREKTASKQPRTDHW